MTEAVETKLQSLTPQYVVDAYKTHKARERNRKTVAKTNWPTVLAHSCEAYAVFMRTTPPELRRNINANLAMIFSEGNDQARLIKRDLMDAGFEVSDEEGELSWPKYQISGRKDLKIWKEGFRTKMRTEVKTCSPFTYDAIHSATDLMGTSKPWLAKWWKQVALYMILEGADVYWMLLKNKSTGAIKIIEFQMTDAILDAGEAMLQKAERVNKLVQIGELPPASSKLSDPDICSDCEFLNVCLPDLQFGPGIRVLTDEEAAELELMLDRRAFLEPLKKEFDVLDGDLKDATKAAAAEGQSRVMIGSYVATLKKSERKAYTVPAQSVTSIKFAKLETAPQTTQEAPEK